MLYLLPFSFPNPPSVWLIVATAMQFYEDLG
jgi:hypothetical protein